MLDNATTTNEVEQACHSYTDSPLGRIRAELEGIRAALAAIEREVARMEDEPPARAPQRARSARYYRLLIEVYERGPHGVSTAELDELARHHGYDRRGLNGYFAGMRAPLRSQGGRVHLTLEGRQLVVERLQQESGG